MEDKLSTVTRIPVVTKLLHSHVVTRGLYLTHF